MLHDDDMIAYDNGHQVNNANMRYCLAVRTEVNALNTESDTVDEREPDIYAYKKISVCFVPIENYCAVVLVYSSKEYNSQANVTLHCVQ